MAETEDLTAGLETPTAAPTGTASDEGDLFAGDTPQVASETGGEPAEGKPTTPAEPAPRSTKPTEPQIDWRRVKEHELPENLRPAWRTIREFQAGFTRAQQEAAEERRQLQQERQQYMSAIQQLRQQPTPQAPAAPPTDPIQDLMQRVQSPEERQGLELVNTLMEHRTAPLVERLQQTDRRIEDALQRIAAFEQRDRQQQQWEETQTRSRVQRELADLRAEFDDVDTPKIFSAMSAFYGMVNEDTGQPYTLREAYLRASGKYWIAQYEQQQQERAARTTAKRGAGAKPAMAPTTSGRGPQTQADSIAELKQLGF